ncbi:MAG: NAD-dependent epimerase/dehydratase family protein [Desulfobulbaceae bacterium]|jgi:nucleoside-diphosphate-sugar epimerase|nr:NAD-dependent epimerase/dehydratase family protein [Desulfobulbaceae bacterium]
MKTILVTGGAGFIGGAILRMAKEHGLNGISLSRRFSPELAAFGVRQMQADIGDGQALLSAFKDVDTVFHVAAIAGVWGHWRDYQAINIDGTANVLAACRACGVPNLVYTSTPSVVFAGDDICGGDENLPYPRHFLCHYAKSKAIAEKMVLAANGENLKTCAIRPHLVWGPGDPHLLPRLIAGGRAGALRIVGNGGNLVDISYIDNVAHAHLLAADKLGPGGAAAGKAYFISQGEPVPLWSWINTLFSRLGIAPVVRKIPFAAAYGLGAALELLYRLGNKKGDPPMTRFVAGQLAKSHYFSIRRANCDLGYQPLVTHEEGLGRAVEWLEKIAL